jgi:hypothetical protein
MKLIGAMCILMIGSAAFAGGMETVIAPSVATLSGKIAEFAVYVHNTGHERVSVRLPARVICGITCA